MIADRTETTNLAESKPKLVKRLASDWHAWAKRNGLKPKN